MYTSVKRNTKAQRCGPSGSTGLMGPSHSSYGRARGRAQAGAGQKGYMAVIVTIVVHIILFKIVLFSTSLT